MADFIGVLAGGICTLMGGFGGAWLLARMERRNQSRLEEEELFGALSVTGYEIVENIAWIESFVTAPRAFESLTLADDGYRSARLTLAKKLAVDLSDRLASTYAKLPPAQADINLGTQTGDATETQIASLTYFKTQLVTVRDELAEQRRRLRRK
jgi:hypothetical protein